MLPKIDLKYQYSRTPSQPSQILPIVSYPTHPNKPHHLTLSLPHKKTNPLLCFTPSFLPFPPFLLVSSFATAATAMVLSVGGAHKSHLFRLTGLHHVLLADLLQPAASATWAPQARFRHSAEQLCSRREDAQQQLLQSELLNCADVQADS